MFRDLRLHAAGRLAALLLLAACDGTTAPSPGPAPVYDLVFTARVRGFDELWRLPLEGGTPQPLLAGSVNAWHPAPSPGGLHVAYLDMGDDEIWLAPVGGAPTTNLSQYLDDIDMWPAWSPDGTRIAFTTTRTGGTDIYVVNADGSQLRNLMPNDYPAATFDEDPAWSPDGTRIAFSSDRAGSGHRTIWTMRADGSDLRPLTSEVGARDYEPSWSPDGRRIVVRRWRSEGGLQHMDLAIVTVATGAVVELAQPGADRSPSWSPDGSLIAFTSDRAGEYRVYTMKPDGSDVVERAGGLAFGRHVTHPAWIRRN